MNCEHEGCSAEAIECRLFDENGEQKSYLCPEHAEAKGYCACCGDFAAGLDGFDWVHPGFCDNCQDDFETDTDDGDDEDWEDWLSVYAESEKSQAGGKEEG